MRIDKSLGMLVRRGLLLGVVAIGVITLVASGGGGGGGESCGILVSAPCNFGGPIFFPAASVVPAAVTVQVGNPAAFEASTNVTGATYSWCKQTQAGGPCVPLPGATSTSLRTEAANLSDDGATYRFTAVGREGTSMAFATLAVSSMPGVVFADGDFAEAEWAVSAIVDPAQNGPSYTAARIDTGGNPGAWRRASYDIPRTPGSVRILLLAQSAVYDPAVQGAVYRLEFSEDCSANPTGYRAFQTPLIEQGGRRFAGAAEAAALGCTSSAWTHLFQRRSLQAGDFVLVQGTPCSAGSACPDFSAAGAPIRLGLMTYAELDSGLPPNVVAHMEHGFDNWRATVWRH